MNTDQEQERTPPESKPLVLDYASTRTPVPSHPRKTLVKCLAVGNVLALMCSPLFADFIQIPLSKKLAFSVATCVVASLVVYVCPRRNLSQLKAVAWFLIVGVHLLVMWCR